MLGRRRYFRHVFRVNYDGFPIICRSVDDVCENFSRSTRRHRLCPQNWRNLPREHNSK